MRMTITYRLCFLFVITFTPEVLSGHFVGVMHEVGRSVGDLACRAARPGTKRHGYCVRKYWCRGAAAGNIDAALFDGKSLQERGCPVYWVEQAREEACIRLCRGKQCSYEKCARLCNGVRLEGALYDMYRGALVGVKETFGLDSVGKKHILATNVCLHGDEDWSEVERVLHSLEQSREQHRVECAAMASAMRSMQKELLRMQNVPHLLARAKDLFVEVKGESMGELSENELVEIAFFAALQEAMRDLDVVAFSKDVGKIAKKMLDVPVKDIELDKG